MATLEELEARGGGVTGNSFPRPAACRGTAKPPTPTRPRSLRQTLVMMGRSIRRQWPAVGIALALLVSGCATGEKSGRLTGPPSVTRPAESSVAAPAEPALAPVPTAPPVGTVIPFANAPEGIVVGTSGNGAVAVRRPDGVALIDAASGAVRIMVPTTGAARHLGLAGADGPVLAPLEASNEVVEITLPDGRITQKVDGVGHQPHDIGRTEGGTLIATNELGGGVIFIKDGAVVGSLPDGPPQPGGLAVVGRYAAVADVQGNGVWVYDGTTRQLVAHAPVGTKLTHAVALRGDEVAFADTDGGAVLIEQITPAVRDVARIDAPGRPYGLGFDTARNLLFVTLTESNLLRVVDVMDPAAPKILGDVATVRQPNSVTVNPSSGSVLITGSRSGPDSALQIVPADLLPRRH